MTRSRAGGASAVDAAPLTAGEFAAALDALAPASRLAVAVSGGPDSLALALLAHEWAAARGATVAALTVDHGLRDGSDAEAAAVAGRMKHTGRWYLLLPKAVAAKAAGG